MKTFIQSLRLYCILIFLALYSFSSYGTHYNGSYITWKNVGKDSFKVTLNYYRDCTGVSILNDSTINVSCKSGNTSNLVKSKTLVQTNQQDVTQRVCGHSCTMCKSSGCSFYYGFEKIELEYLVVLNPDKTCCKIEFSYTTARRLLSNRGSREQLYLASWVDICKAPKDHSPKIREPHPSLACKDTPTTLEISVFDAQYDSFSFNLRQPSRKKGVPTTYPSPYSYLSPIRYKGFPNAGLPYPFGFHMDSVTGALKFTSTERYPISIISFEINSYRNDQKIGNIHVEKRLFTDICSTKIITKYRQADVSQCEKSTQQYQLQVNDSTGKNTEFTFYKGNLPGNPSFYTYTSGNNTYGVVSYEAPDGSARKKHYEFMIQAKNETCPIIKKIKKNFKLKISPNVNANIVTQQWKCNQYILKADSTEGLKNDPNSSFSRFIWEGKDFSARGDSVIQSLKPGQQNLHLTIENQACSKSFSQPLNVDSSGLFTDLGPDTSLCPDSDLSLSANTENARGFLNYQWNTGDTTSSVQLENLYQDTTLILTVTDSIGCEFQDSKNINIQNFPDSFKPFNQINNQILCTGSDSLFIPAQNRGHKNEWLSASNNDTLTISKSGKYGLKVIDTSSNCFFVDSFKVNQSLKDPEMPDTIIDKNISITFDAENPGQSYSWNTGDTTQSITIDSAGIYLVSISDTNNCQLTDSAIVNINKIELDCPYDFRQFCWNASPFQLNNCNHTAQWEGTGVTNNKFDPQLALQQNNRKADTFDVIGKYTDSLGYTHFDTVQAYVKVQPDFTFSFDRVMCKNDSIVPLPDSAGKGNLTWLGSGIENGGFKPEIVTPGNHSLLFTYQGPDFCQFQDTVQFFVKPLPSVDAGKDVTVCEARNQVELPATTSNTQWITPLNVIQSNHFIPELAGIGNHEVILQKTANNGCQNKDTAIYKVKENPEIQLPFSDSALCANQKPISLNAIPIGGIWQGPAITQNVFDPRKAGKGQHFLAYSFTAQNQCKDRDSIKMTVHPTPQVSAGPDKILCFSKEKQELNGTPENKGQWLNPTIQNNIFNIKSAGVGSHKVQYKFKDSNGCKNTDTATIEVKGGNTDFQAKTVRDTIPFKPQLSNNATGTFNKWKWKINGEIRSTERTPNLTIEEPGYYTVTLIGIDTSSQCRDTIKKGQYIHADAQPEYKCSKNVNVFPNPAKKEFKVEIQKKPSTTYEIKILNIKGKVMNRKSGISKSTITLHRSGLPDGTYFMVIPKLCGEKIVKKIELQK